jgi:hypothetical protein
METFEKHSTLNTEKKCSVADSDPHGSASFWEAGSDRIQICNKVKRGIRIRTTVTVIPLKKKRK